MSQQPPHGPPGPPQQGQPDQPRPDRPENPEAADGQYEYSVDYSADPPDPWADAPETSDDHSWPPQDSSPPPPEGHVGADTQYVGAEQSTPADAPEPTTGFGDDVEYEVEPYPPSWPPPSPYNASADAAANEPDTGDLTPTETTPSDATPSDTTPSDTAATPAESDSESTHLAMRPHPGPPQELQAARAMPPGSSPYAPRDRSPYAAQGSSPYSRPDSHPTSGPQPQPEYEITYAAPGAVPTAGGSSAVSRPTAPKSKRGLAWTALAVVAALIAGAAVWFFLAQGNEADNEAGGGSSTSAHSDGSGSSESGGSEGSGSSGGAEESGGPSALGPDGKLTQDAQLKISALYDGYTKTWEDAAASGDFAPVAKYAADNAHPDFQPDQAQCLSAYQAKGAKKGYREKTQIDFATVAAAPDWTPPGASEKPKGEVFTATAQQYAGVGLAAKPQPVEVYFAFVDGKAYMFPDCG
ncbi:hypothetical protein EK0264_12325 [Epidermidibacterium keratini]|uniref:Uncharacterized protein n=1 Tax=Epidermidibacterium keratini TaxID=1891644 RepID=A0A7L4YNZ8_9ACTN|nr:hypothetical protein [Epidermidibacterium keratini]QHC00995.1 hypothetical protein EK0264_12325 [Epidermidibacterium keratini]